MHVVQYEENWLYSGRGIKQYFTYFIYILYLFSEIVWLGRIMDFEYDQL